tara:strand:- start:332 stop:736 length:405 start_codon:yes stop_codon:yes gene_type:complete
MASMKPEVAKTYLGLQKDGFLSRCPDSPNCVCSCHPDDKKSFSEPYLLKTNIITTQTKLRKIIDQWPGATLVKETSDYWHVEFVSKIMKFVDDLEVLFDDDKKLMHIRSASRLGYSDLGANRKRVTKLFAQLDK